MPGRQREGTCGVARIRIASAVLSIAPWRVGSTSVPLHIQTFLVHQWRPQVHHAGQIFIKNKPMVHFITNTVYVFLLSLTIVHLSFVEI